MSGVAVIALIVQIFCLAIIFGIFYIWKAILEQYISSLTTTASNVAMFTVEFAANMTTTAPQSTTAPGWKTSEFLFGVNSFFFFSALPDLIIREVGQFIGFILWTTPGWLLVMRSKEGGMLAQDVLWNVISILTQLFNLVLAVFVSLGRVAHAYAPAAVAVSFGAFYFLDLVLMLVLSFSLRAKEQPWEKSSDYMYR